MEHVKCVLFSIKKCPEVQSCAFVCKLRPFVPGIPRTCQLHNFPKNSEFTIVLDFCFFNFNLKKNLANNLKKTLTMSLQAIGNLINIVR